VQWYARENAYNEVMLDVGIAAPNCAASRIKPKAVVPSVQSGVSVLLVVAFGQV